MEINNPTSNNPDKSSYSYNPNSPETTNPMPSQTPDSNGKMGPLIGTIIVILVLVIGAIYYFVSLRNDDTQPIAPYDDTDRTLLNIETQSPSDELDAIENDVNATNMNDIDADIAL